MRQRRALYEAVIGMEQEHLLTGTDQEGAIVIAERDMTAVDVVLTPTTCMCVWTEQQLPVSGQAVSSSEPQLSSAVSSSISPSVILLILHAHYSLLYLQCFLQHAVDVYASFNML